MSPYEKLSKQTRLLGYEDALAIINAYLHEHPEDEQVLTLRGMKHWGAGRRADALNDYLAAIALNPQSHARAALEAAGEILDYRNKDLYNP